MLYWQIKLPLFPYKFSTKYWIILCLRQVCRESVESLCHSCSRRKRVMLSKYCKEKRPDVDKKSTSGLFLTALETMPIYLGTIRLKSAMPKVNPLMLRSKANRLSRTFALSTITITAVKKSLIGADNSAITCNAPT